MALARSVVLLCATARLVEATKPAVFDCAMRRLALEFAKRIQGGITERQLQDLADALNGSPEAACRNVSMSENIVRRVVAVENVSKEVKAQPERASRSLSQAVLELDATSNTLIVSPDGDDASEGSLRSPLRSISAAVASMRRLRRTAGPRTILVRAGVYREPGTIELSPLDSGLTISAYPGETAWVSGAKEIEPDWKPASTGRANIWVTRVPEAVGAVQGLRVGGRRGVRARWPNADPEVDLNPKGWVGQGNKTKWLQPLVTHSTNPPVEYIVKAPEWVRNDTTGNERYYQAGINGSCGHFEPPYGYWCSARPAREVAGKLTHRWPSGLVYEGQLQRAPYKDPRGAIVHSCRGGANCWFTWMFEVDNQSLENKTLSWTVGGFQGAEGSNDGGSWHIENVFEELDAPNEFFFDPRERLLYYYHNDTAGTPPPKDLKFEATDLKVLLNVSGTQKNPVKNVTVSGLCFRDAAYTFMDVHGMPSGGDWALQRTGALFFAGTENVTVDRVFVSRVDGIGIFINGYNRNLTVQNSEMVWIGESGIAAWGYTAQGRGGGNVTLPVGVGIDGTGGEQPRGTRIVGNVIHEVGVFQKQSSMFFQAQSCQTLLEKNVFYNGPRAHINFNDQFGGANRLSQNLLLNACRETADHGPFNSWGRQPYITEVRDGVTPSITPAVTEIDRNFVIGSYNTQESIDNDDGSEYFESHHNFFAYGQLGLKSDFGGHDNRHHNNLYAYISLFCIEVNSFKPGHEDAFFNNTCVQLNHKPYVYLEDCKSPPIMHDNRIYDPVGNYSAMQFCKQNLRQWQEEHDPRSTISKLPPEEDVIRWAAEVLRVDAEPLALDTVVALDTLVV